MKVYYTKNGRDQHEVEVSKEKAKKHKLKPNQIVSWEWAKAYLLCFLLLFGCEKFDSPQFFADESFHVGRFNPTYIHLGSDGFVDYMLSPTEGDCNQGVWRATEDSIYLQNMYRIGYVWTDYGDSVYVENDSIKMWWFRTPEKGCE